MASTSDAVAVAMAACRSVCMGLFSNGLQADPMERAMRCPVCGSQAKELPKPAADRHDFRCLNCGKKRGVSSTVLDIDYPRLSPQRWREIFQNAEKQAKPGEMPIIRNL
jgi:DNA-directed RNA polymerase subunit RPC12/RpoP